MKRVIGLTGGMGSGKSTVAALLARQLIAASLDADRISRELAMPGAAGWRALESVFGNKYFNPDQSVNRPLLRREIFRDAGLRDQVGRLLHPLVRKVLNEQVKEILRADSRCQVIVEVPLLLEAGWEVFFDAVVVVYASDRACIARLASRDGLSAEEARLAVRAQWPLFAKAVRADHVIDNSGSFAATCLQVLHLAGLLRKQLVPVVEIGRA